MTVRPPIAARHPVRHTVHGIERVDDYAWLRADNWQEVMRDPATLAADIRGYLEAENAYTKVEMADTEALQALLFKEMRGRIKEDDSSVPAPDGPFAYATRFLEGAEQPRIVRTPRAGGAEEVLIDVDALAKGHAYYDLGGADHSPDHALMAWSYDDKGSESYTLRVRDLSTGADLDDRIETTTGGAVWSADSRTLFYTVLDDNHRPCRIYRHRVGAPTSEDVLVFEETNPGYFLGIGQTQSARYLVVDSHDHETSELHVIDAEAPDAAPRLIAPRRPAEEYDLEHNGDLFYILTNADGAEDFKIVTAPVAAPGRENWTDLVPHRSGRLILGVTLFKDFMVRLEREGGLPRIVIRALATGEEHAIAFDEEAYSLGLSEGYEFDTTVLRFTYSSMTTPSRVYDYDMAARTRVLRKEQEVPSGHDASLYVTRRIFAPAHDGETVPVSLLYRKDTPLDGSAPLLLYGYGSYGITIPASFSTTRLSLVDRGIVYAIAHIRGGKDKGFRWYAEGRREKKENSFLDFISAGEFLAKEGFTSRGRIVGWGGSAGGMLMGAVANMAPDLFGGIVAEVPFVDVLNTMLDDTLPLTPPEWPEWGNPIESEEAYRTIAGYSPYDNVAARAYPPILAVGGLTDPRVTYWEPAKWVAKLRAAKTSDSLLLLKTNMDAGHGGASGRFDSLKESAFATAFVLKVTGRA
ncbi:S9 family peptidase [Kaistia geumhonensis]|uniref:Oligopeptidase B n=1 Tax=Kaistia geumhonensis TaxID=410839 RepID=A0ABU0M3S4_9HYPH|nr:S9 family peptidase [Kaistia geumhonensis]MCX5479176.1 S9 family peptidase [Kaistia geumhonensis]MDQ0515604.1 oligopeptidase B [Kaistia geumhonensis]